MKIQYAFQRQSRGRRHAAPQPKIMAFEFDFLAGDQLHRCINIAINGCIHDGAAMQLRIGRNISTPACQAKA